ncbi:PAS domain-containing sensor histidine kinase [Hyalangium rubrum]|uniref:histidine kinase n=1 Tax=Hyalangium rubrum TaxID=3103134 RepID=A0ABU5GUT5_9BACT|nr:ATP-binding protein [Hyalangium sp. s54d21]MDY7224945.1 ATP-binding protein [Hyalangium sp. s54d21]
MAPARAASNPFLELSLEQLRLLVDSFTDSVWVWDARTDHLLVNRHWLQALGYEEEDLEPNTAGWRGLLHPDDVAETERRFEEHMQGQTPHFVQEYRLRRKDGQWAWILDQARAVARDEQGKVLRVVGTNLDITARKLSEERMRGLLQAIPDLIFRTRADGTFLDVKPNADMLTPHDNIIGSNLRQAGLPQSLVDKALKHLELAIRQGTVEIFEYEVEGAQGPQHFESRTVRSGPDEGVTIIRDITERKLAEQRLRQHEEELRRHHARLEELVQSRTEKLRQTTRELEERQAQLIQSEKMASLGQMAAGIAHEISSPMGYIMSNLNTLSRYVSALMPLLQLQRELLAMKGQPAEASREELLSRLRESWQEEDVDSILVDAPELLQESLWGAQRIKELAQNLRLFTREDSGEPQPTDLNAELESTLKIVWNELKYKCEVRRDFGTLPLIRCHPTQLAQVFTNLLINAAQAIEEMGTIHIQTRHEGHEVVVRIADTGKGMTPETRARLFTPFFTTKPRGQGTGLGLSISYSIIARHKGLIEVQSEPGKGTTFIIRLPVTEG